MANPARAPSTPTPVSDEPTYEGDLYAWSMRQAEHLRAGNFGALDLQRLAEEIEDVGKSEFNILVSALTVVIQHMLKWDQQPAKRTRSWALSIDEHRFRAERALEESPSLRSRWDEAVSRAYYYGVRRAARETRLSLSLFPAECPYSTKEIRQREFPVD